MTVFISLSLLMVPTYCYVVSQTRLNWNFSSIYCQTHCTSQLASIHSSDDMTLAIKTINESLSKNYYPNLDIWIGLNDLDLDNDSTWIDQTPRNYGNTYNIYPWADGHPLLSSLRDCIEMDSSYATWNWTSVACIEKKRALCNHCDSKLTKYIGINTEYLNFTDAEQYCHQTIGTHLASIYSIRDMIAAQNVCKLATIDIGQACWIGLYGTGDGNWTWTDNDNVPLQFGSTFEVFPWEINEPIDRGGEGCVTLQQNASYLWKDFPCAQNNYLLCNLPSEICATDAIWHSVVQVSTVYKCDHFAMRDSNDVIVMDTYLGVIDNKQWDNHGNELLIELRFHFLQFMSINIGTIGVAVFNLKSLCEYYYIAVGCSDLGSNCTLFIRKYNNDQPTLLTALNYNINFESGSDAIPSTLLVKINYKKIEAFLNENVTVSADVDEVINDTLSGYIGIKGEHCHFTVKSLYVSGTQIIDSNNLFSNDQCNITDSVMPLPNTTTTTTEPTIYPTKDPMNYPSKSPSIIYPTKDPINYPSKSPSIIYGSGVIISTKRQLYSTDINNKELETNSDNLIWTIIFVIIIVCIIGICFLLLCKYLKRKSIENPNNTQNMEATMVEMTDKNMHKLEGVTSMDNDIDEEMDNDFDEEMYNDFDEEMDNDIDEEMYEKVITPNGETVGNETNINNTNNGEITHDDIQETATSDGHNINCQEEETYSNHQTHNITDNGNV